MVVKVLRAGWARGTGIVLQIARAEVIYRVVEGTQVLVNNMS
jgi:hypothetical protein